MSNGTVKGLAEDQEQESGVRDQRSGVSIGRRPAGVRIFIFILLIIVFRVILGFRFRFPHSCPLNPAPP